MTFPLEATVRRLAAVACVAAAAVAAVAAVAAEDPAVQEARLQAEIRAAQAAGARPATADQIHRFLVAGPLPAPAPGVADLKFHDVVKLPIGPRGAEMSERALSLVGRQVRMVGYLARQAEPMAGVVVLVPLPVDLGDEDESLSDDLPVHAVFVHLAPGQDIRVSHVPGLLQFTGTFEAGPVEESDGHVSNFRLRLDEADSRAFSAIGHATVTGSAR